MRCCLLDALSAVRPNEEPFVHRGATPLGTRSGAIRSKSRPASDFQLILKVEYTASSRPMWEPKTCGGAESPI